MLSTYSAKSLAILVDLLPDIANLATEKGEVFQVTLTTPSGWDFWLSSEEEEQLTVGFAEYHCHFGGYSGDTPEADATEAASFIKSLHNGDLMLAVWYQDGKYAHSQLVEPYQKPQILMSGQEQTLQIKKWAN